MTPLKIIGGVIACVLMASGSVSKPKPYAAAPKVAAALPLVETPRAEPVTTVTAPNTTVEPSKPAVVSSNEQPATTDGPTPLTEAEFADLQKWLRAGKPLQEWIHKHPDPALKESAQAPPTVAEQMLAEANRLGPYRTLDPLLTKAAEDYAVHLARTNQQGHFADGDPEYRAKRAGFTGSLRTPGRLRSDGWTSYGLGEVLAFGPHDSDSAFEAWLDSPGHKEALMESTYDVAGFANVGTIWIGIFGNSRVTAPAPKLAATPQPVRYDAPQTYSSCGPGGCGSSGGRFGIFRRRR